jgi:hypothetical protein
MIHRRPAAALPWMHALQRYTAIAMRDRAMWLARAVVKVTTDAANWSSPTSASRDRHEHRMCRPTAVAAFNAGEMSSANLRRSQRICWDRYLVTARDRDSSSVTGATLRRLRKENLKFR